MSQPEHASAGAPEDTPKDTPQGAATREDDRLLPLQVVSATPLTPRMVRLRLAGTGLAPYEDPGELHVRLYVPKLGRHDAVQAALYRVADGADLARAAASLAGDMAARYYTLRRVDARAGWVDIDFVLHRPRGPGSAFAQAARPGDICAISRPCGRGARPAGQYLIAGDETALPAMARIAESLPADARGAMLIEVDGAAERIDFAAPAGMAVHWLYRDGARASTSPLLLSGVRAALAGLPAPDPSLFVWMAGEWRVAGALRPLLATYKPNSLCVSYWRADPPAKDARA
ncbi:iron utilization protein [Bordetella ansorpii]|uniref:Iron utilization protein n=1 Tax=Bordetella ansorpii TaxID=288768 RepID=A0A157LQM6_9BORD|nr:siderophore-interacting protein [Bordetella ansorpii]SAH99132.1 iron utilization protein [Bordetella ansorpii]